MMIFSFKIYENILTYEIDDSVFLSFAIDLFVSR